MICGGTGAPGGPQLGTKNPQEYTHTYLEHGNLLFVVEGNILGSSDNKKNQCGIRGDERRLFYSKHFKEVYGVVQMCVVITSEMIKRNKCSIFNLAMEIVNVTDKRR